VVDERGEFIGFVSECDILRVLEAKKDLNQLTAEDVMAKEHISVTNDTSIDEAVKIMEEKRLLNLPLKVNGRMVYSITRHDLLRAWIGLGMDIETNLAYSEEPSLNVPYDHIRLSRLRDRFSR
jgi:predicted transcriptional regulator